MNNLIKRFLMIFVVLILAICLVNILKFNNTFQKKVTQLNLYGDMEEMNDKKDVRTITTRFEQGGREKSYYAEIKVQGSSSLAYEKKNYTIKFFDDAEYKTESTINLGWGKASEYCLKANWIDKTHSRNVVTAKLAAEVQEKYGVMKQAPCNGLIDGFPVEVYINDRFHGMYTWNIPKAAWMFGMDENNPNHIVMCGEDWEQATLFYDVPNLNSWSVEAGPESEETLSKFTRLSEFVMNSSDEEFAERIDEYLNLDALLNYYILVDFAYLPDNCGKNMLFVTYNGKIWYPSLYDLDTSWGVDWMGKELYDYENELVNFSGTNNLARRLENVFSQELYERYFELRKKLLTKEHVLELFIEFDNQISEEGKNKEVERWGEDIPGYDISQIEDYLDSVINRLDEKYRGFAIE